MRSFLYRHVIYPGYHALRRDGVNKARRKFKRSQWLSPAELAALQQEKLAKMLQFAAANVPYYRALFEECGFAVTDDTAPEDLQQLPPLTKSIIRERHDDLVSEDLTGNALLSNSTSGSTGEAIRFFTDYRSRAYRKAAGIRADTWTGWKYGQRAVSLWGAAIDEAVAMNLRGRVRGLIAGHRFLSSFDLSPATMDRYIDIIGRFKPVFFLSYPGPLETFARHCKERGVRFPSLKAIVSSAETLWPHQLETIEDAFGVQVYNRYGCREVGLIACECKVRNGMHICTDRLVVEIVDDDNRPVTPGQTGRMLITDLDNYGMPLVRYDIGDRAVAAGERSCACGRGFPMLEEVAGRTLEIVVTPDGRQIGGTFWTLLLRSKPAFRHFQVVQEAVDGVVIRFVPDDTVDPSSLDYFTSRIKEYCGADFRVDYSEQESIDLTVSGKQRVIISLLETGEGA